jgi:hypothetical protein
MRDSISNVLRAVLDHDIFWNNFVSILDELDLIEANSAIKPENNSGLNELHSVSNLESGVDNSGAQMAIDEEPKAAQVELPAKLTWKQLEDLLIAKLERLTVNDSD